MTLTNFKAIPLSNSITVVHCNDNDKIHYYFVIDTLDKRINAWKRYGDTLMTHEATFIAKCDGLTSPQGMISFIVGEDNLKACREWLSHHENKILREITINGKYSWSTYDKTNFTSFEIMSHTSRPEIALSAAIVEMIKEEEITNR